MCSRFPESHIDSLFSSAVAFLMMPVASQSTVPSMPISVEGKGSTQQQPGQESVGDAPGLSHCSLLRTD